MGFVTVNIMWKILHSRWTVVLQLEWSVLQWTLCGRYFTAGGQWYCSLNGVRYSVHSLEGTSQQVAVVLQLEWSALQWHYLEDISQQADSGIAAWMECVTVNIMWKIFHSRRTVVMQLEWSALQWTFCGRYFTAGGQWYFSLNVVCYSEHFLEDTSQQVDSGIAVWLECVTVNIMWKILHSRWRVVLQHECSVLQWTLCGRYFTAGGQWYCSLNGVCYSEHYVEDTTQQVDSGIAAWMEYVTVNIMC